MTGIPSIPSFSPWKIGAGIAIVIAVVLSGFILKLTLDNRRLSSESAKLSKQINDPDTGYIARLRTSENNVLVLKGAVVRQNQAYDKLSKDSKAQLEALRARLIKAEREAADLRKRAGAIASHKIEGVTLEERVLDVDKQIMEDLKK